MKILRFVILDLVLVLLPNLLNYGSSYINLLFLAIVVKASCDNFNIMTFSTKTTCYGIHEKVTDAKVFISFTNCVIE